RAPQPRAPAGTEADGLRAAQPPILIERGGVSAERQSYCKVLCAPTAAMTRDGGGCGSNLLIMLNERKTVPAAGLSGRAYICPIFRHFAAFRGADPPGDPR